MLQFVLPTESSGEFSIRPLSVAPGQLEALLSAFLSDPEDFAASQLAHPIRQVAAGPKPPSGGPKPPTPVLSLAALRAALGKA